MDNQKDDNKNEEIKPPERLETPSTKGFSQSHNDNENDETTFPPNRKGLATSFTKGFRQSHDGNGSDETKFPDRESPETSFAKGFSQSHDDSVTEEIKSSDGKLLKTVSMKNGKPNGSTIMYDENGNIAHKLNYKDGVLDGPAEFYQDGELIMSTSFENNEMSGKTTFFMDGVESSAITLKNGTVASKKDSEEEGDQEAEEKKEKEEKKEEDDDEESIIEFFFKGHESYRNGPGNKRYKFVRTKDIKEILVKVRRDCIFKFLGELKTNGDKSISTKAIKEITFESGTNFICKAEKDLSCSAGMKMKLEATMDLSTAARNLNIKTKMNISIISEMMFSIQSRVSTKITGTVIELSGSATNKLTAPLNQISGMVKLG